MIKKSLQQFCEENQLGALLKEWDYEKNCDLRPENISYGSAQKVWWKCDKGHSWQMDVNHRTGPDKNKCPICSNRRILVGYNDLATTNPEIASEWHPTNNGTLNPHNVTCYSNKKVWWLGKCGHEWQAVISSRTGNQSCGCPYCSNQKTLTGYNDLATTHPALASEWHPTKNLPLTQQKISAGSAKKAWWLGKCGHEWQAVIASRARDGVGCPYCAKKMVIKGVNDLATTNPELAAEWDYEKNGDLKPKDIFAGTAKKVWWKCSKGHSWLADTHSRKGGNKCPICANQKVLAGYNDLQTRNPHLAAEWHPTKNGDITPADVMPNTNKKFWWLGLCGHEWQSVLNSRSRGCGCPICSKRKRTSFPEQAIFHYARKYYPDTVNGEKDAIGMELDIYIPSEKIAIEYDGSIWHNDVKAEEREHKKNQKCKDAGILLIRMREEGLAEYDDCYCILCKTEPSDAELNEEIKNLMSELGVDNADIDIFRDRYDIYSSFVTDLKQNSLAVLYPEIAADWHKTKNGDLKPDMFPAGSEVKIWWECPKGHEWQAIISSRTKQGTGCPYCAGLRVLPGYNDLETISPQLAAEWHPTKNGDMKPNTVAPFSNKKYWWLGKCGHEYQATPNARSQGSGCPYCVGKKVLVGFNDLATTNPELAAEWDQEANGKVLPTMVTKGSNKKAHWVCKQGHKWIAVIASRNNGTGCPYCSGIKAIKGFNDLATTHPDLIAEWDYTKNTGFSPETVSAKSERAAWWKCKNGHKWRTAICNRTRTVGCTCPYCSNRRIMLGENDLATTHPNLAKEWNYEKNGKLIPQDIVAGSGKKVWWKCEKGHEWQTTLYDRTKPNGTGCPYCSGHITLSGYNDLATLYPDIAARWHPEKNGNKTPETTAPFSNKKVWWLGECGHEWQTSPSSMVGRNSGCPYCSGHKILLGFNDLSTTCPDLANEWDYEANGDILPTMVAKGSEKKIHWICNYGHKWMATVYSRSHGNGCPFCAAVKRGNPVRCIETGIVYSSAAEAERATNCLHIADVCRKTRTTSGGYHWEYI